MLHGKLEENGTLTFNKKRSIPRSIAVAAITVFTFPFVVAFAAVASVINIFRNIKNSIQGNTSKFGQVDSIISPYAKEKMLGTTRRISEFRNSKNVETVSASTDYQQNGYDFSIIDYSQSQSQTTAAFQPRPVSDLLNNPIGNPYPPVQSQKAEPEIPNNSIPAAPALLDKSTAVESKPITAEALDEAQKALKNKGITAAGSDDKSPGKDTNHTKEQGQRKSQRNSGPGIPGN